MRSAKECAEAARKYLRQAAKEQDPYWKERFLRHARNHAALARLAHSIAEKGKPTVTQQPPPDDDRMFQRILLGEDPHEPEKTEQEEWLDANYKLCQEDPDHWCKNQQELKRRLEQLESSRAWWIIGLVVVIGIMGFYIWDRNQYISDLWTIVIKEKHETICELVKKLPSETEVSDHEGCPE